MRDITRYARHALPVLLGLLLVSCAQSETPGPSDPLPDSTESIREPLLPFEQMQGQIRFLNGEFLSNPTTHSVIVSLVPAERTELFVQYGRASGTYDRETEKKIAEPETLVRFDLEGLEPGTRYFYRVRCRNANDPEEGLFADRSEYSFRTLREGQPTFRFAFATDSHVVQTYTKATCGDDPAGLAMFRRTMQNLLDSDLDFLVVGGDEVHTHTVGLQPCTVQGEDLGDHTVQTSREAELRYHVMRRYFEEACNTLPFFMTMGNHDGEAGFGDRGRCSYFSQTTKLSSGAREKFLPNAGEVYSGSPDGNYYAFESGDALFVILDVMRYNPNYPMKPDDWTLGKEQLQWLGQVLSESEKTWKFLFAHHLVGGDPIKNCYHYGRGGLKSTDNGQLNGNFLGEQAIVHDLMKEHGAQIFFYGHDHVFLMGEKKDLRNRGENVHYVLGGQSAGQHVEPFWSTQEWFKEAHDYDGDSRPDFLIDKGFVRVTVNGHESVLVEYVKSDIEQADQNGKVLFSREIKPDPPNK